MKAIQIHPFRLCVVLIFVITFFVVFMSVNVNVHNNNNNNKEPPSHQDQHPIIHTHERSSGVSTSYPLIESCQLQPPELKDRIMKDLESWPVIKNVTKDGLPISLKTLTYCSMILRIVNNELYIVQEKRGFPMRAKSIKVQLHDMLKRYKVPNVEFCINIGDKMDNEGVDTNSPCFVLCKRPTDDRDIVIPDITFGAWPDVLPMDYLRERELLYEKARTKTWADRKNELYFRGTEIASRHLIKEIAEKHPEYFDVLLHVPKDNSRIVPLEEICDYNYLLHFEGVSYSSRIKYLMMCNSTVIWGHHAEDRKAKYIEFWYDLLKPYKHYIPLDPVEEAEALNVIKWIKENQDNAKRIAQNGYDLTVTTLSRENIECYWQTLLKEYATRLNYTPTVDTKIQDYYTNIVYDERQMKLPKKSDEECEDKE